MAIRSAYEQLTDDESKEVAAVSRLPQRRISEILTSPLTLAHASLDEVQALTAALELPSATAVPGGNPPGLPPRSLSALSTAAELQEWDGQQVIELLQRGHDRTGQGRHAAARVQ